MTFLHPWALGFGAIAPAIVLLYLLKVRRRPLTVSTLHFWQRALQENRRRALFQRLRRLWSLLLHLLIFALVLLALAQPGWEKALRAGSSLVLVLDARARMQAIEPDGETRFARALRQAQEYARQAGPARQMAIITAGAEPAVAVPFTGDAKALRDGLAPLRASARGGELESAVRLGRELLASRIGERRLIVLTDRPGPDQTSVATAQNNLAIVQFAARALPGEIGSSEVLLRLANFGRAEAKGNVEIALDGRPLDVRPFQLSPGEESTRTFPLAEAGGTLTAKLDTHDALPLDDTATAQLPAGKPPRVLLVSAGNWFLEKLLEAETSVRFELLTPESYTPALAAGFDVVIFDDFLPRETPSGNALYLGRSPFNRDAPDLAQPLVTDADAESPVLQSVHLEHVALARSAAMALPAEGRFTAPLRFGDVPLLIVGEREGHRIAALGFRVADSDLPLRVAFPLLMSNLIHWLAGDHAAAPHPLPSDLAAESDLRGAAPSAAEATMPTRLATLSLWQELALAATLLLAAEWWLFHRRQTE